MHENEDSAGRPARVDAIAAELERQIARVGINLRMAFPQLHEIAAPVSRPLPDGTWEESFTIDVSGIVATLQALPNNAGTAAFVAAYNAANPAFSDRPDDER